MLFGLFGNSKERKIKKLMNKLTDGELEDVDNYIDYRGSKLTKRELLIFIRSLDRDDIADKLEEVM